MSEDPSLTSKYYTLILQRMVKAFIFDFDGVIVNNEQIWLEREKEFLPQLVGQQIFSRIGPTVGLGVDMLFKKVVEYGSDIRKEKFMQVYFEQARSIYKSAPFTPGLESLVDLLIKLDFSIGVVSASPGEWIDSTINRLPFKDRLQIVITLYDRRDLAPKPAPDGYIEAMRQFNSSPRSTIILEDSNTGIAAAKASGAYTVAFRENLVPGYQQTEKADAVAENMQEVAKIVQNFVAKI